MTVKQHATPSFSGTFQGPYPKGEPPASNVLFASADNERGPTAQMGIFTDRVAQARPLRVLIVEDEALVAMDLEFMLEEIGAEIVGIAMSAAEAEALVRAEQPDLVTMDINIKGDRDGVSAAKEIYERYGIRPIFISAYSDLATRNRGEPCRPIAWIEKPIDREELAAAISLMNRNGD